MSFNKGVSKIAINGPLHEGKGDSIASKNVVNENISNVAVDRPLQELETNSTGSKMVVKETFETVCVNSKLRIAGVVDEQSVKNLQLLEVKTLFDFSKSLPCLTMKELDMLLLHITDNKSSFIEFVSCNYSLSM